MFTLRIREVLAEAMVGSPQDLAVPLPIRTSTSLQSWQDLLGMRTRGSGDEQLGHLALMS